MSGEMRGFPYPAMIMPMLDGEQAGIDEICSPQNVFEPTGAETFETPQINLGFDPLSLSSGLISSVGGIFQTIAASKIAKKQAKIQEMAIKAQREQNARDFALSQVQLKAAAVESAEERSRLGTYAIAGVLGSIGLVFVFSAIRTAAKKRDAKLKLGAK